MKDTTKVQFLELEKLIEVREQILQMSVKDLNNTLINKSSNIMVNSNSETIDYAKHINDEITKLITVTAPLGDKTIEELPSKTITSYVKAYYVLTKIESNEEQSNDDAGLDVDFSFYTGFTAEFNEIITSLVA